MDILEILNYWLKITKFDAKSKSAILTLTVKNTMKSVHVEEPAEIFDYGPVRCPFTGGFRPQ